MAAWICCLTPHGCKTSPWMRLLMAQDPTGRRQEHVLATDTSFCAWNQQRLAAETWSEAFSIYPTTWQDPGSGPAALNSLPCAGIPCPVQTRVLMDQDLCGQSLHEQAGFCWPGFSSAFALPSTLTTNPGILEFLRFVWATWKLLHRGQELQAKCLKVFVGRLHTTSCYKRSSSRTGLSQCWSTFLTTEDTLYIM